jgi:hypothetical protein
MSTQVPITVTHRGRSRRIVVEPIKASPRKSESPRPTERVKAPAETAKAPAETKQRP